MLRDRVVDGLEVSRVGEGDRLGEEADVYACVVVRRLEQVAELVGFELIRRVGVDVVV